jgi:type II secretory pathway pseudopilin PulG
VLHSHGFTLAETLIATAILVTGLVAVASLFSWSTAANHNNRQRTAATILLSDKMEQFKLEDLESGIWTAGGSLNPDNPAAGYWDYVTFGGDGTLTVDTGSTNAPYLRLWAISGSNPKTVTVIVYARRSGLTRQRMELIRATTMASRTF